MMSIGKLGQGLGIDDSELSNGIVGVNSKKQQKPKVSKHVKASKDKKKKKAKKISDSDESDTLKIAT